MVQIQANQAIPAVAGTNTVGQNDTARLNTSVNPALHKPQSNKPVIKLGDFQTLLNTNGKPIAKTQIKDRETGQTIEAEIIQNPDRQGETYNVVANINGQREAIAMIEFKIVTGKEGIKNASSLEQEVIDKSILIGFNDEKPPVAKVENQLRVSKYISRFPDAMNLLYRVRAERMLQEEQKLGKKFAGIQLISSWNSAGYMLEHGYQVQDHDGIDTISAKKADRFIREELDKANNDYKNTKTQLLGCTTMYLPWRQRRKWKKKIKKAAIFEKDDKAYDNGKVKLMKKDGTEVTAQVRRVHDPGTGMDRFSIVHNGKEIASILVNYMQLEQGQVKDYCGNYSKKSPFSQYGNGYIFGIGAKKARSKVFIEMAETNNDEFSNLEEQLYQIPMEIAHKDPQYKGRVQMEADWNDHAREYHFGFRTQKYRGFKKTKQLDKAIKDEIALAKKEKRMANCKQFGSQLMTVTREEALKKLGGENHILSNKLLN